MRCMGTAIDPERQALGMEDEDAGAGAALVARVGRIGRRLSSARRRADLPRRVTQRESPFDRCAGRSEVLEILNTLPREQR
jgi:hypothetical protein